jgi:iron uptake system EfeUOB component EfeO/EfeM
MRTYVWTKADGSEHATDMRDRLTVVVRSALLDRPCLDATDPRGTFKASIEETTMREEFSDLTLLKGDRVLAGSYVAYEMQIDEIVARASFGQVSEIEVDFESVGPAVEELPE